MQVVKYYSAACMLILLFAIRETLSSDSRTIQCPTLLQELNFLNTIFDGFSIYNCEIVDKLKAHALASRTDGSIVLNSDLTRLLRSYRLSHLANRRWNMIYSTIASLVDDLNKKRNYLEELYEYRTIVLHPNEISCIQSQSMISFFPKCNVTLDDFEYIIQNFRIKINETITDKCKQHQFALRRFAAKMRGVHYSPSILNNVLENFCEKIKNEADVETVSNLCTTLKTATLRYYESLNQYIHDKEHVKNHLLNCDLNEFAKYYEDELEVFQSINMDEYKLNKYFDYNV